MSESEYEINYNQPEQSGYEQTAEERGGSGYQGNGYGGTSNLMPPGYGGSPHFYGEDASSGLGGGDNPWSSQQIENPYTENVYEVNWFDTPYQETFANTNPQGTGYQISGDSQFNLPDDDQQQLEL